MPFSNHSRIRLITVTGVFLLFVIGAVWTTRSGVAQAAPVPPAINEPDFEKVVKPFFTQHCVACHDTDTATAGIRVDQLDASFGDNHIRAWEAIRKRVEDGTMPPKGTPQPGTEDRRRIVTWITQSFHAASIREVPKNGLARRLTIAQYRNTLRELLGLEDDLTVGIPPDAVSKDGFVNNQETLHLSTQLLESYFEVADTALRRAIVDPKIKPSIQNFRVDLGASVNPDPFPEPLILGAGSALLDNKDVMVTQLTPVKPFAFEPHFMRTKYRFLEGYRGNDTVRGWREYDSIYHAVFADMRGSPGYPKGLAHSTVPEGLLLRPAMPNDEIYGADSTYGPRANFKISLRELPDDGRFRVTVMAAKYNDGLMLDTDAPVRPATAPGAVTVAGPATKHTIGIRKAGIYQVDLYAPPQGAEPVPSDASRLSEGLSGQWLHDGAGAGTPAGQAQTVDSPLGKALSLPGDDASLTIARGAEMNLGTGDFTVALWVRPQQFREAAGMLDAGASSGAPGWSLDLENRSGIRFNSTGPDKHPNGAVVASGRGTIRANTWQHVAVVVKRERKYGSRIYVNGRQVARGEIGSASLDNPKAGLQFGHGQNGERFHGDLRDLRLYRRALGEAEVRALSEPGLKLTSPDAKETDPAAPPPTRQPQEVTLTLGDRQFAGTQQSAFLAVRLEAGELRVEAQTNALQDLDRVVLTPLPNTDEVAKQFLAFEKRTPRLGVHFGFRRDCGSTFAPVGSPQTVAGTALARYVFEGAMHNYPNPDTEKNNVNYLAGVREIGVRSEFTDGRDMPRLLIRSVEFEGPYYDTWPPKPHRSIFIESARRNEPLAYAQEILRSFATRAYRRPASAAEVASLMAVYERGARRGFEAGVRDALQVALTSPQFLFLVEKSRTPAPEPLDDYELASKLSYFLWNGPPDRTLLSLAANGTLRNQLDAQVGRMMDDDRFHSFVSEFATQWLSLDKFAVLEPDRKQFPLLTRDMRTHLREEPVRFIEYLMRRNLPVRNLIQSDFILADEAVATYYGLGDKTESGFRFVPVVHGRPELGGVLTEAAILAGLSDGREPNPVKRGAWLARKIISEPPADPPPNVPVLREDTAHTLRERIEQHRSAPACAQCHAKIDPWGIALEEFDAGGRFRTKPADAHSTLPDKTEVSGIGDLKRYLGGDRIDQVAYSVLRNLTTYATGRTPGYSELNFLRQDQLKLKADGYRMKDMIRYVAESKMFLEK